MRAMAVRSWARLPILLLWASAGAALHGQSAVEPAPDPAADLVQRAQQKQHDGKLEEAVPLFRQAVQMSPRYFLAHQHFGIILDLTGDYVAARTHLFMAQQLATTPRQKAQ